MGSPLKRRNYALKSCGNCHHNRTISLPAVAHATGGVRASASCSFAPGAAPPILVTQRAVSGITCVGTGSAVAMASPAPSDNPFDQAQELARAAAPPAPIGDDDQLDLHDTNWDCASRARRRAVAGAAALPMCSGAAAVLPCGTRCCCPCLLADSSWCVLAGRRTRPLLSPRFPRVRVCLVTPALRDVRCLRAQP